MLLFEYHLLTESLERIVLSELSAFGCKFDNAAKNQGGQGALKQQLALVAIAAIAGTLCACAGTVNIYQPVVNAQANTAVVAGNSQALAPAGTTPASTSPSPQVGSIDAPLTAAVEVRSGPVRDVIVLGLHAIAIEAVMREIAVEKGASITAAELEAAKQRVYALGTFQRVDAIIAPIEDGARLTFTVVENPALVDVTLVGVTKFATNTLTEPFLAGRGNVLDYNKVKQAVKELEKTYRDAGFAIARVSAMDLSGTGVLTVKVAEGVIHDITLRGNAATVEAVIRREIATQPGDVFESERFKQDLRRVNDLGLFRDITLKFENVPGTDQVSVIISLVEK